MFKTFLDIYNKDKTFLSFYKMATELLMVLFEGYIFYRNTVFKACL